MYYLKITIMWKVEDGWKQFTGFSVAQNNVHRDLTVCCLYVETGKSLYIAKF